VSGIEDDTFGRFTDDEHGRQCEVADCEHAAVHEDGSQEWCPRCRAVAFGGTFEGMAVRQGKVVRVAKLNELGTRGKTA